MNSWERKRSDVFYQHPRNALGSMIFYSQPSSCMTYCEPSCKVPLLQEKAILQFSKNAIFLSSLQHHVFHIPPTSDVTVLRKMTLTNDDSSNDQACLLCHGLMSCSSFATLLPPCVCLRSDCYAERSRVFLQVTSNCH
jgi:hypothetical protein